MRIRIVLGVALALVGIAVVAVLSQRGERLAGTSFVVQQGFTVVVPPHGTACQRDTYIADDSAAAELMVGTYGGRRPPLTVAFLDGDGDPIARGRLAGGARQGRVTVPLERVIDGNTVAQSACVHNGGTHRVALAGDIANPDAAARIDGRPFGGLVGFRYLRDGSETWWSLAPIIAQRFGLGKAGIFGSWTLPLLALLLAAVWFATIRLLLRGDTR